MKVLVCGGREFDNEQMVENVLSSIHGSGRITRLINGGARGADKLAWGWANRHGVFPAVYKAQWDEHGPAAGPIRNSKMLKVEEPDLVVAFPGGVGTADMVKKAHSAGVPVIDFNEEFEEVDGTEE
jgi:hypothetical protein